MQKSHACVRPTDAKLSLMNIIGISLFVLAVQSSTASAVIALNQTLVDALARGDKAAVARIYAKDFVRVTVQGGLLTREQVLASVAAPAAGLSYESKDIQVFDYGTAAVVTYLSIRRTKDKPDFLYRVTDTFVLVDGQWQKAASAGTPVTQ